MKQPIINLSILGLGIGVLFGLSGSMFQHPQLQIGLYEISSVGLTMACLLLAIKYLRETEDLIAAGFLLFAVGEAVMSAGTALGADGGQAAFGAGIALYVPSLLLISLPKFFPPLVRLLGTLTTLPFGIAAVLIFSGEVVYSTSPLAGAGYGLLSMTILGWIYVLRSQKVQAKKPEAVVMP